MKYLLFTLMTLATGNLRAQCGWPNSQIDLHSNNIVARILNGGDLFTDFNHGQFIHNPNPVTGSGPSSIFAAGLWMGGIDQGGNLRMATVDYRYDTGTDYSAGPLDQNGLTTETTCQIWDKQFFVTGEEIASFLAALPMTESEAIQHYSGIMGWPASGNPYFNQVWGFDLPFTLSPLAPFVDVDEDSFYDPLHGDYPAVALRGIQFFVPAQMVWCVFNDQQAGGVHSSSGASPVQMEVQLTAWTFHCTNDPILDNTVFTSHKLISRTSEPLDSFHLGLWVDFDLGCGQDDYAGCIPSLNTMFAYNQDAVDGNSGNSCAGGVPVFTGNPPVQSATFLNKDSFLPTTLTSFMEYGHVFPSPGSMNTAGRYRMMTGSWPDGTPITKGGNGYGGNVPTRFMFPDDPANPAGWSMCTANLPGDDVHVLGTTNHGQLLPGDVIELNTAWALHLNGTGACNLGDMVANVEHLQQLHQSGYAGVCSPLTRAPVYPSDKLTLSPNPANNYSILHYGSIPVKTIEVFDATGKWIRTIEKPGNEEYLLNTTELPAGVYQLKICTDQNAVVKKLVIGH